MRPFEGFSSAGRTDTSPEMQMNGMERCWWPAARTEDSFACVWLLSSAAEGKLYLFIKQLQGRTTKITASTAKFDDSTTAPQRSRQSTQHYGVTKALWKPRRKDVSPVNRKCFHSKNKNGKTVAAQRLSFRRTNPVQLQTHQTFINIRHGCMDCHAI